MRSRWCDGIRPLGAGSIWDSPKALVYEIQNTLTALETGPDISSGGPHRYTDRAESTCLDI